MINISRWAQDVRHVVIEPNDQIFRHGRGAPDLAMHSVLILPCVFLSRRVRRSVHLCYTNKNILIMATRKRKRPMSNPAPTPHDGIWWLFAAMQRHSCSSGATGRVGSSFVAVVRGDTGVKFARGETYVCWMTADEREARDARRSLLLSFFFHVRRWNIIGKRPCVFLRKTSLGADKSTNFEH